LNGIFCRELAALLATRHIVSVVYVRYHYQGGEPEIIEHKQHGFNEYEISIPRKTGLFSFWYHQYQVKKLLKDCLQRCSHVDVFHVQVGWKAAWDAAFLLKRENIPLVITEHNTDWLPRDRKYPFWKRLLTAWAMRRASAFTAVSANLAEAVSKATGRKILEIPNPVDSAFTSAAIANQKHEGLVFLHVSNFNLRQKQTDKIIRVFSQYVKENPNARLQLNVPEDACKQFKMAHPDYAWENIECLPPVADKMLLLQRMQNADFLLSYSLYETFGLVIAEALCLGVPAIYTPCKGADIHIDDKMGICCDADSEETLLEAFRKSGEFSADRNYIASSARKQFNGEAVLHAYELLYDNLIK
jgi:glycosyltransferase involved in cell wall biosynthesis